MTFSDIYKRISILLCALLVACGGGGSAPQSASAPPPPAPAPPPPPAPPVNQAPSVNAGEDVIVVERNEGRLVATATDVDGTIASMAWVQLDGPPVTLDEPDWRATNFQAPYFYFAQAITFRFTATDDDGSVSSDDVVVWIEPDVRDLPIQHGQAYFVRRNMPAPAEYFRFATDPTKRYRIVLRSYLFDDDMGVYSRPDFTKDSMLAISSHRDLENEVVYIRPGTRSPVYVEVIGWFGDLYTLSLSEHSEFIEDGFPVETIAIGGTSGSGADKRGMTVGNIDADPELEILFSGVAAGPLYALDYDGAAVPGWPRQIDAYTTYPSLGNLSGGHETLEIALGLGPTIASCRPDRYLLDGTGTVFSGWPVTSCVSGTLVPPTLVDINGDGIDEVFFGEGYYVNGQPIPGWPAGQPSVADVSGDGRADFVYSTSTTFNNIEAYDIEGNLVPGFPIVDDPGENMLRGGPIGLPDFDGDGRHEIVRMRKPTSTHQSLLVEAYDGDGNQLWETRTNSRVVFTTVPAFGDLDGDGLPELLIQTSTELYAWRGDGSLLPGFPTTFTDPDLPGLGHRSAPLVGDVTGDGLPDVVVGDGAFVWVFDATGHLLHQIRVGNGIVSAIADVDLDGRNEIVTGSNNWNGNDGERFDSVWLLDLGGAQHGPVQWGQVGGNARRHFSFPFD